MMEKDKRAEYLESGRGDADDRLTAVRSALDDPVTWEAPPHTIADGVLAGIKAHANPLLRPGRKPTLRRFAYAAAAVTAVIVLIAIAGSWGERSIVELAGTELQPNAIGTALMEPTDAGWSIRIDLENLPPAGNGFYYEGWVWSDDGEGVSIGTFHLRNGPETLLLWSGVDVNAYPSIWISRQEEGAGAEVSDEIVMVGRLDP